MTQYRKLLIGGLALLVIAGALFGTLRVMYGQRSALVHVRWAPSADEATQAQVERTHGLKRVEFREQRTWLYSLTDVSSENIRDLVRNPAVEDTHHIDRKKFTLSADVERGGYTTDNPAWLADIMEFLVDACLAGGVITLVAGAFIAWRDRRARRTPSAAA
jgi:hypothetical protein